MNKKVKKIINILKKKKIITASAVIVIIILIALLTGRNGANSYDFIVATNRDITQGVSITGKVQPTENVDLAFEQTGTIAQVLANIGDIVTVGQTLVTLRNSDTVALLKQAEAQVDVERASLTSLMNNANAEQSLTNTYDDVLNTINNALAKSEDSVRSKTSGLFGKNNTVEYNLTFDTCSENRNARELRLEAELELNAWNKELASINTNSSRNALDTAISEAQSHLDIIGEFIDSINKVLLTDCVIDNSALDIPRTNMATAQTNVLTEIDNVNTLQQEIASKKVDANNNDDINTQEAKVRAAEAGAENYRARLAKTIIRSPINGIVTKQDASAGESASINISIISIISVASFEIEANIPEVEIAKIKTGANANITLDAYGENEIFGASVSMIDPAETIISGVPNYKTTLIFNEKDERIKSGMTANIDIFLEQKISVIAIPRNAIEIIDGKKFVKIIVGEKRNTEVIDKEVTTGITGSDGFVEIISGVSEGDKVILPTS